MHQSHEEIPESKVDVKIRAKERVQAEAETPLMVFLDNVTAVAVATFFVVAFISVGIVIF